MVGGINKMVYLPAKLAEQLGYFKEEGLDVELQSQPAGVDAENELLAGAVQAVVGFYDHSIDLQTKGKEITAITILGQVPGEVELVSTKAAPHFKSMADAKGKTLGVTGLGSSTNFLTRYLASRQGITSKQFSVLPVGADNTFIAAMKQGRIEAGMTTEPTASQLLKTGDAQVLVDMRTVEGTVKALGGCTRPPACMCSAAGSTATRRRRRSWRAPSSRRSSSSTPTAPSRSPRRCPRTTTAATRRCTCRP
jgi:NitT/TauT family transport system substrate-binding protein